LQVLEEHKFVAEEAVFQLAGQENNQPVQD